MLALSCHIDFLGGCERCFNTFRSCAKRGIDELREPVLNLAGELIRCRHDQDWSTAHDRQVESGDVVGQGQSVGVILTVPRRHLRQDGHDGQAELVQATDELRLGVLEPSVGRPDAILEQAEEAGAMELCVGVSGRARRLAASLRAAVHPVFTHGRRRQLDLRQPEGERE